ncbi:tail fiber domain-containing protein [Gammaproteobacteria bacterium]|nr:tail fiber domain-containing protein [Gammaproteobacteria bacterium]
MAGYTRQSTFADGDTITAALFNNEYNQLVNAFSNTTGHSHDGTAASGPVIGLIGDAGETSPNNKVLIDTTNNYIEFYVEVSSASVQQLYIADGAIIPVTDSDIDLGTTSLRFKDTYTDTITTTGNVDVGGNLTVTGTTTFNGGTITMGDAATDNVVFGADVDSNIIPDDDDSYDLGSASQEWRNLYIDGTANIDSLVADTADINGGTIDGAIIGGSSAAAITGTTITGTSFVIGSADISETELEILDGATVTTDELNILDGVTATTAELNLMDGVTSTTAELNILNGVTSTAAELNILDGVTSTAAELNILDGVTSTATELNLLDGVTATTSELNILDGVTASATDINLIDGITNGTVIASKAIITDANKDITGGRNITITGELDAATLDISGDADIDGTLEADAITIGGITLAETISDTVGAMVSSNTETNITVSYDDADNTLDFVIGTLNQDTTGNAATATALETARTIHGVSFDGTANIDLSEVIADTVGAMVSSNTETNITVAYQDDDNTLDFTIGTLNQDTTGNAATATALETARTIGGTSFDGTANIAVNLSATATALATARTIGGVSFDGTANIVPTTFNAATFSGDLNVDSGVLFADVSTNRVGINQASPDVSLDVGSNTDAIHVPSGTTAERPASPAAGYFRYNSTTGDFEGYTDAWGAIAGGGGGTAPAIDTMTGDGSDTTLTLTSAPVNENATVVTIDGVVQHKDTYSVSSNTLTFSEAPPTGTAVECITWTNTAVNSALLMQDADGDTQIQVEESSDEDKIRFDTGGTERMIIDSTGVGIGTSSPDTLLNIASSSAPTLRIENTDSTLGLGQVIGAVEFYKTDTSGAGAGVAGGMQLLSTFSTGSKTSLAFSTSNASGNNVEGFRLDEDGNLLVGTTDSAAGVGNTNTGIALGSNNAGVFSRTGTAGQATAYFNKNTNDGDIIKFNKDGSTVGSIGTAGGGAFYISDATYGGLGFSTLGAGDINPVNTTGGVRDAAADLGQPTARFKDLYLSGIANVGTYLRFGGASNYYIHSDNANYLRFGTAGSERMRITSSGTMGFGMSPLGTNNGSAFFYGNVSSKDGFMTTGTNLQFLAPSGGSSNTIFLRDNGNESMRIDSSGNLLVGKTTTADTTEGQVLGSTYMIQGRDGTSAHDFHDFFRGTAGSLVRVGNIRTTGTTTAYNTSSDGRLKDVTGSARGLEVINELNPVAYNWKSSGQADEGLIAQEVLDIVPNAVSGSEEEMYQMDYSKLVVHLVAGMKEQQTQIEALQSEINLLKGE